MTSHADLIEECDPCWAATLAGRSAVDPDTRSRARAAQRAVTSADRLPIVPPGTAHVECGALHARLFCRFGVADSNLPTYCWMNSIRTVVISTPCAAVAALKALCKSTSTLMFTLFTPVPSVFLIEIGRAHV